MFGNYLDDIELVAVVPIVTGITFVITFHRHCISFVRPLHTRINIFASFVVAFLSPKITTDMYNVPSPLSLIRMSGLLLWVVLSVFTVVVVVVVTLLWTVF